MRSARRCRVEEVVRDDDRRQVELAKERPQLGADLSAAVWIERGHRLVEQEDSRPACEGSGECHSLALSSGQLSRLRLRELCNPESLEEARAVARERDVALHREVREQRVLLEDVADRALLGTKVDPAPEPRLASDLDRPAARAPEPGDRVEDSRLAGPGGADQRHRLAADLER